MQKADGVERPKNDKPGGLKPGVERPNDDKPGMNAHNAKRMVVGVMSGTSLDGIDVAVVQIKGSGSGTQISIRAYSTYAYSVDVRERVLRNSIPESSSVSEISRLNVELAHAYASAIRQVCSRNAISLQDIDLVGCHGQTLWHDPRPDNGPASTLQVGDPATLAHLLSIPVVGDFRTADMALGGQGAPLVPYADWALFSSPEENRILLNLGGIANITALAAGCKREDVIAFDTGPANMLIDGLMQRLRDSSFDKNGAFAQSGHINDPLLATWMKLPYFNQPPPKSTGRELFNRGFVDRMISEGSASNMSDQDLVATATALTVQSVVHGIHTFIPFAVDRLIVSGGGAHNEAIMSGISDALPNTHVDSLRQHGMDPDAKEAVCFAILAHEAMNGVSTGMPSVTGALTRAFSGKICMPGK